MFAIQLCWLWHNKYTWTACDACWRARQAFARILHRSVHCAHHNTENFFTRIHVKSFYFLLRETIVRRLRPKRSTSMLTTTFRSMRRGKRECVDYYCYENSSCGFVPREKSGEMEGREKFNKKNVKESVDERCTMKTKAASWICSSFQSKRDNCVSAMHWLELIITSATREGYKLSPTDRQTL